MNKKCKFCETKHHAKGLCQKHYRRDLSNKRGIIIHDTQDLSLLEKLKRYSKLDKETGCIEWVKSFYNSGYGQISSKHTKESLAHRASYEANFGKIPIGVYVCHTCDNPKCINPKHLFLGTPLENMIDRNNKKRQANGTKMGRSNLCDADILYIRKSKEFLRVLSKRFGISMSMVSRIKLRKSWVHI